MVGWCWGDCVLGCFVGFGLIGFYVYGIGWDYVGLLGWGGVVGFWGFGGGGGGGVVVLLGFVGVGFCVGGVGVWYVGLLCVCILVVCFVV